MWNYIMEGIEVFCRKHSPYIVWGAIGAVVMRLRSKTKMSFGRFLGAAGISIFVSLCVGKVCDDYLLIKSASITHVLCGLSGVFSPLILDEAEDGIKFLSNFIKRKIEKK